MSKRTQSVSLRRQPKLSRWIPGFTLIELVMTIAMAAILLSIAVPSFQEAMRTNRIAALSNELSTSLQLARSEAVSRGRRVTVCKSDFITSEDIDDNSPACNSSADWQDGWIVFVDSGTKGSRDASSETLLRISQPSSDTAEITGDTNFANYVSYLENGRSDGVNSQGGGIFSVCISPQKRTINISPTGRLSIETIESGTCP